MSRFGAIMTRATKRVLSHAGDKGALLRGVPSQQPVHVAQHVEIVDRQGNVVTVEFVGVIDNIDFPLRGNTLFAEGSEYILDTLIDNNGYSSRFMLLKRPAP